MRWLAGYGNKICISSILLAGLAIGYLLYNYQPTAVAIYPPCPFLYLTGLYCPGCGSLRAIHYLLHAEFFTALAYNPLLITAIPFLLYWLLRYMPFKVLPQEALGSLSHEKKHKMVWQGTYKVAIVLMVIFWVLRNIPFKPWKFLAPGGFFS